MRSATAAALDAGAILVFVGIGRSAHTDGVSVAGMASTAWPFLTGAAIGWVASRAWRRPAALVPSGTATWIATVAVGMVLRVVSGQGTAAAFVVVALAFLGAELLGWRTVVRVATARRSGATLGRAVASTVRPTRSPSAGRA
ncbi:MAG TPA: DUF3054 domain-containing protein [Acidimicrobiales bacterium]|nr:DUF3054 domain-containing protein [Acidimicrobiales bacterium]